MSRPKTGSSKRAARLDTTPPFEVKSSPIAGLGVFATRPIKKGARLIEYIGERISAAEADARYDDDSMVEHHTMLFEVDDDTVIDGARFGNEAKYFNHGCAPNCRAVNEDRRIFIEAIADVSAGTELVYDYALKRDEPWQEGFRDRYRCRCGAASCKGTILKSPKPPRKRATKTATAKRAAPLARKKTTAKRKTAPPQSKRPLPAQAHKRSRAT